VPFWGKFNTFWPLPCSEDLKIIVRHIFIRLALIFLPFSDNILLSGRHGHIQRLAVHREWRSHRRKGEHIRNFAKIAYFLRTQRNSCNCYCINFISCLPNFLNFYLEEKTLFCASTCFYFFNILFHVYGSFLGPHRRKYPVEGPSWGPRGGGRHPGDKAGGGYRHNRPLAVSASGHGGRLGCGAAGQARLGQVYGPPIPP
jgi:hypothetical protein